MSETEVLVPRLACLDGPSAGRVLYDWLRRPSLQSATLVSFAFDADFRWIYSDAPTLLLTRALQAAAANADVTILIADKEAREATQERRRRVAIADLLRSGVTVLTHDTLHAKAFLFEEEGRCCWIVGSSNLTSGGLGTNAEVNLRGFHPTDYQAVRRSVQNLLGASHPYDERKGSLSD